MLRIDNDAVDEDSSRYFMFSTLLAYSFFLSDLYITSSEDESSSESGERYVELEGLPIIGYYLLFQLT